MANVLKALQASSRKSAGQSYPVDNRGGWNPFVREPYSGAWQNNDGWELDCVLAFPTVYSCITLISNDIAKLPPRTVRETEQKIWVAYTDQAVKPLLVKPNRFQNHIQFKQWWITSKLIRGNAYALKQRASNGAISALYVLDPSRVQVLVAPDGSVFYQLGMDWLNGCYQASITVPASEIIHDRMNCLFHPLVGISPLFASGLAANTGLRIQNDASKFFANGANPSGILTAPGEIAQATADRLKTHWETNYTGKNAGRVAVLGDGLEFQAMRMNSVDAQLIEQMKWSDLAVCSTFHVPPYKVGVGQMPSQSNVEALTLDYYTQCLQILIEEFELCMDQGLEMKDGTGIELDLDVLFRMDSTTLVKMLGEEVGAGIGSPDEARLRLNKPPVSGGNTPYLQEQNFSLAALAKRDAQEDPWASKAQPAAASPSGPPMDDGSEDKAASLDGAQMIALRGIISAVMSKEMPCVTACHVIRAAFPWIPQAAVEEMLAPLKEIEPVKPAEDDFSDVIKLLPLFLREEMRCEL